MGTIKYFSVNGKNTEFESYLVSISKARAIRVKGYLKKEFGKQIEIRIVKVPKKSLLGDRGEEYDLYTNPDERHWHKLRQIKNTGYFKPWKK